MCIEPHIISIKCSAVAIVLSLHYTFKSDFFSYQPYNITALDVILIKLA